MTNNSLDDLPNLLRSFALGRLNKKGKTDLINLLITQSVEKDKEIRDLRHKWLYGKSEEELKDTEELRKKLN